jgi:ribonuclease Y
MNTTIVIIIAFASLFVGYILRLLYSKMIAESAEQLSERIIKEANMIAETKLKEALLDAKLIVDKERREFEHEIRDRKQSIQNMENRLNQREENLDRKMDVFDKKEKDLSDKEKDFFSREKTLTVRFVEIDKIKEEQKKILERISGMTREEAKKDLVNEM